MTIDWLLPWSSYPGEIHTTSSPKAAGFIYPSVKGYYWEVVSGGRRWVGETTTVHSAKAHVEGNFIARGFLYVKDLQRKEPLTE